MLDTALTVIILSLATLISAIFGFGGALVAMPLLTLLLGLSVATPLCALMGSTITLCIVAQTWQRVEFTSVWRLFVATLIGIPVGIRLVQTLPEAWMMQGLGVILVVIGGYRLTHWKWVKLTSSAWAFPFGLAAGILGGAFNTNGPPIVIYGELKRWQPQAFCATLQGYFLPSGLVIVLGHGVAGLWTTEIWRLYFWSLLPVLATMVIGLRINQRIAHDRFQTLLACLLIALGLLLLHSAQGHQPATPRSAGEIIYVNYVANYITASADHPPSHTAGGAPRRAPEVVPPNLSHRETQFAAQMATQRGNARADHPGLGVPE